MGEAKELVRAIFWWLVVTGCLLGLSVLVMAHLAT